MKGRKNASPLTFSVFFALARGLPFLKTKEAPLSKCVPWVRKGRRDSRVIHGFIFHLPLWIRSVCESEAWCNSITLCSLPRISDCKHKCLQKPERPLDRLYPEKYFLEQEKQPHRCTDKWHVTFVQEKSSHGLEWSNRKGVPHLDGPGTSDRRDTAVT